MPHLLQLEKEFTQYQLQNICQLRSQYSIRIYELLRQYTGPGRRVIPLDELKNILGVEKKYQLYHDMQRFVFSTAHRDITTKTDLSYHWRPIKTGRKVTSIEFYGITMKDAPPGIPDEKAIREAMAKVDALTGVLGKRLESPYKNVSK